MTMMINRPLTDDERELLMQMALGVVTRRWGIDAATAADVLDGMALTLTGDAKDAYLSADGNVLVHAERDWLAFHAAHPGYDPAGDGQRMQHGGGR